MPEDALVGAWTKSAHRLWVRRLRRTSSLAELLQVLFSCPLHFVLKEAQMPLGLTLFS
jgi:hypothetical protein